MQDATRPAGAPEAAAGPPALRYAGAAWPLFRMTLAGTLLTFLTLGVYRFWLLTRQRRHYWTGIRLRGEPLEYLGRPWELLLGFLIAIAALALILGLLNLLLTFAGFALGADLALNLGLLILPPLIFFARYRARRYLLARTRWRGVRMGMEGRGIAYAWRATLWALAVLLSAGLLWPVMQVRLRRHLTERTWFGDLRFRQEASAGRLMGPWLGVWVWGVFGLGAIVGASAALGGDAAAAMGVALLAPLVWLAGLMLLFARYAARAHNHFLGGMAIGGMGFAPGLRAGRLLAIWWRTAAGLAVTGVAVGLAVLAAGLAAWLLSAGGDLSPDGLGGALRTGSVWQGAATIALALLVYAVVASPFAALYQVILVQGLLRAYVDTAGPRGVEALDAARQRPEDAAAEAGGFADALDAGAAF